MASLMPCRSAERDAAVTPDSECDCSVTLAVVWVMRGGACSVTLAVVGCWAAVSVAAGKLHAHGGTLYRQ
ncbi:hypothetical protein I545_6428 [Mycobacterium kansasii 662]|nr:hypothetical protein I545_6428 [Mycobacterium kansasii 662]VAZ62956.1 hypothetical protein LAUMK22_04785 [Mycobacterium kansasii]VAZ69377.1 hypothetical protein LAUMK40_05538 [Mycobacterium kansasii]VAZ80557.1 hypothetical protein LAUMK7_05415 [Mycobacterium kansasii]VTP02390.1 hypothetical protein BIN_B_03439 [Mycobacterium kansasii]